MIAETLRRFRFAPLLTATVLTILLLLLVKNVANVLVLLFLGILISLYLRAGFMEGSEHDAGSPCSSPGTRGSPVLPARDNRNLHLTICNLRIYKSVSWTRSGEGFWRR